MVSSAHLDFRVRMVGLGSKRNPERSVLGIVRQNERIRMMDIGETERKSIGQWSTIKGGIERVRDFISSTWDFPLAPRGVGLLRSRLFTEKVILS